MSLYDESIEVVEYQRMLEDIKADREIVDTLTSWVHPLADRPDVCIDHNGETWIVAPVSKNQGIMVPIFYRFTYLPKSGTVPTNRPMAARKVRHPNRHRPMDSDPKTAKPTKRDPKR